MLLTSNVFAIRETYHDTPRALSMGAATRSKATHVDNAGYPRANPRQFFDTLRARNLSRAGYSQLPHYI
jgi:hypothetical protein